MIMRNYKKGGYVLLVQLAVMMSLSAQTAWVQKKDVESYTLLKEQIQQEQFRLVDRYQELAVRLSNEADSSLKQLDLHSNEELKIRYTQRLLIFLKILSEFSELK